MGCTKSKDKRHDLDGGFSPIPAGALPGASTGDSEMGDVGHQHHGIPHEVSNPRLREDFSIMRQRAKRRKTITGRSITLAEIEAFVKPVYYKTDEDMFMLRRICRNTERLQILFGHLTDSSLDEVLECMFEKQIEEGEDIIKQGDEGDYFYIVKSGGFDFLITRGEKFEEKVGSCTTGAFFGELALLYNAPRAATVRCTQPAVCWCLDRASFRILLVGLQARKPEFYEPFLDHADLCKSMTAYEKQQISDRCEDILYEDGDVIIVEGSPSDGIHFLEDGEVKAGKIDAEGKLVQEFKHYTKRGEYFGEVASILHQTRACSCVAYGDCIVKRLNQEDTDEFLVPFVKRNPDLIDSIKTRYKG